eukprot:4369273-Pleurochrysis_carterae.AAC.2
MRAARASSTVVDAVCRLSAASLSRSRRSASEAARAEAPRFGTTPSSRRRSPCRRAHRVTASASQFVLWRCR